MTFHEFEDLRDALADADFDRPPAFVANAHVTGVSVARALDAHGVPVVALDRSGDGAAPPSNAVDYAGRVTYPLDDEVGFREDVEALAAELDHEPVAFGCMDEWALGFAETEPDGVRLPFADSETMDAVLDKSSLYETCEELGIPYPETYRLSEVDPEDAADELGFPLVVKPARKREFEEAVGTNIIEVADREEYLDVVEMAQETGIEIMAQEKVPVARGEDHSLASYVPEDGDPLAVVGNARVRAPLGYGTSCVVERVDRPEIEERALAVIDTAGYHGISEAEFVYDRDRDEFVLLDVNTRPWKWISMPVQAGANLPMAAYADVTDAEYEPDPTNDARWVSLEDYLPLLANDDLADIFSTDDWEALASGDFETGSDLTTAVFRPSDPAPIAHRLDVEFGGRDYYCSC
ncbi:carboxylate--amine ligase [Halobacterium sp. R2-5]|uniref:carboxylate--amine ligase n=1 Tax=Halobacterium sp. R2-5 TaxID=2715751 RepID=UPI00141D79E5|nr:carboxylate--amine ligase [Halobacterium sp. R2-5]NIB98492.1 carboxylate--amine ligase [Halobacterium sp. R2-5]